MAFVKNHLKCDCALMDVEKNEKYKKLAPFLKSSSAAAVIAKILFF
jgi:hypothetical protein